MSQPVKSISKLSRAVGEKLFLKGERDLGPKNAMVRRPFPPGQHGQSRRGKQSDYGKQLMEKQKARYIYGLAEKQMRRMFKIASRSKESTGLKLLQLLEARADNIVYRAGFADSRRQARQTISHGSYTLNGKRIKTCSIILKPGETLKQVKSLAREEVVKKKQEMPEWLQVDSSAKTIKMVASPSRAQIVTTLEEQLIVEYYSRLV